MMFGRGYFGNYNCFGYGSLTNMWGLIITIGAILLIIAIILHFARRSNHKNINDSAIEALKMKLVKGEITEDEYMNKKSILERK